MESKSKAESKKAKRKRQYSKISLHNLIQNLQMKLVRWRKRKTGSSRYAKADEDSKPHELNKEGSKIVYL